MWSIRVQNSRPTFVIQKSVKIKHKNGLIKRRSNEGDNLAKMVSSVLYLLEDPDLSGP